ncbi:MAG: type II secretion system protein GspD [Planctomycetes bacterium]|nr:type II secretion system protein GspD [Planctomycetota bacterium]
MGLTDQDTGLYGSIAQGLLDQAGMTQVSIEDLLSQPLGVVAGGELTIVPDIKNNGLLVRTFSRNLTKLLELIKELDRPRDQVLIDVFITEVLLDESTEFGIDFTFRDDITYRNRDFTINQDVGAAFDPTGLSYQLVSDNITAFISAMEKTGKLDVITRSQIGTKNNEMAMIELGRTVPLIKDTKVSSEGSISSTVTYTDVVTRLQVTPQIHPNRFVSLKIEQTIDDVSTETFQISKDFNPQVIIKRSAKSQLRVKDGQTVCLGGFISDRISRTTKGVPLLSDLPFIGFLFEFTTNQRVKTELLIFITPHILTTPSEMLRMTNAQRQLSNSAIRNDTDSQILETEQDLRQPPYRDPLKTLTPFEESPNK